MLLQKANIKIVINQYKSFIFAPVNNWNME